MLVYLGKGDILTVSLLVLVEFVKEVIDLCWLLFCKDKVFTL